MANEGLLFTGFFSISAVFFLMVLREALLWNLKNDSLCIINDIFYLDSAPYLYLEISPAIPFVAAWLFFFVMATLLRTAFSDPGIVPRASAEEAAYIEKTLGKRTFCRVLA